MKWLSILIMLVFSAVQAEEISFKYNGAALRANLEKAEDWPKGPVVLMTHGTLGHNKMEIMSTLQDLFKESGISSLAINLSLGINNRPSSMYDCPTPHNHKHTDAIGEISAWVEWLKFKDIENIVLLGHSRGGNQTAWYAAEKSDPAISKVILVAPQTWSAEYANKSYKKRYNKDLQPLLKNAQTLVKAGNGKKKIEHIDFIYCKDTTASANAFVSYYAADERMDTPFLLSRIRQPVLLFIGTEDKVVSHLQEALKNRNTGKNIKVEIIDGADHFFRDLYAEDLVEQAVEFIQEQP
jgi:pimeloyl-ACP methyl ester carboxylesterase